MSNPLIAPTQDSTKAYSGISLLETANDLSTAIQSGDWASVAMGAVGTALDALSMAMDPFGAILAAGVSWLMEHVGPLKDALNGLTGNADQIAAQSETWANVAKELGSIASDLNDAISADLQSWSGSASDAYRQRAQDLGTSLQAAQKGCEGASSGVKTAGEVVGAVRSLVRDIISELIGHMISWALQVVFTLGIGLAWVVPQVVSAVAKTASQITGLVTKLVKALKALVPLLKKAGTLFEDAGKAFKGLKGGKVTAPPKTKDLSGTPKAPPAKSPGGDGGGSPKGGGYQDIHDKGTPPPKGDDSVTPSGDHSSPKGGDDTTHSSGAGGSHGGDTPPPPKSDPPPPVKADPDPAPVPRGIDGGGTPKSGGTPQGGGSPSRSIKDDNPDPHKNSTPAEDQSTAGDPVDIATGRMLLRQHDVALGGALPLVVSRTHVSGYRLGRSFGAAWASTWDQWVEVAADGVHFAAADGTLLSYPVPVDDRPVLPASGSRWPLHRAGDGGFVIVNRELDQVWHFAATGTGELPLTTIMDGNGNRIDVERDAAGTPVVLTHSAGHRITVSAEAGLIRALRLDDGGEGVELARYQYDDAGRLTEVVNSSGRPLRFEYDHAGRVVRWDDRNGMWYRYEFDAAGRCVRSTGKDGYLDCTFDYDEVNRRTRVTDSRSHVTEYRLDERWRVVARTDALGHTTRSEWDDEGYLVAATDELGRVTRFDYDAAGNLVTLTNPDGSQVVTTYNEDRKPVSLVTEDGAVWWREYDATGRPVAEIDPGGARTAFSYDAGGNLAGVTDALGNATRIESDRDGRPLAVTNPAGQVTRYTYDQFGRTTAVTDPAGEVTRFAWTVEGALRSRVDPDGSTRHWRYDAEGNLRESAAPGQATARTEIGPFDLLTSAVSTDGSRVEYGYDSELRLVSITDQRGQVWRYTYDAVGNLVSETDFDGRVTRYRHDAAGQLVERINAAGQSVLFSYDLLGRLVERRAGAQVTAFAYDATGRLRRARNDDADVRFDYEHTSAGRRMVETVNGRSVVSEFDRAGRRLLRRTPSGAESRWEYDPLGRPVALHTAGHAIRFRFDQVGREVERSIGAGVVLTHRWDARDRLRDQSVLARTAAQPVQRRSYDYRASGELVGVTDQLTGPRRYDLDAAGRVVSVSGPGWLERYGYDQAGNVSHAELPGLAPGTPTAATAGPREYTGTTLRRAGGVEYDHDAEGRLTQRRYVTPAGRAETWQYAWDAEDHLVSVTTPDGRVWRYRYDPLGRRIAKQLLGAGGVTVEDLVEFTWDGTELVEQVHNGTSAMSWDRLPGRDAPVCQTERALPDAQRGWVDTNFYAIVTDLVGSPQELVDDGGRVVWHAQHTAWGSEPGVAGGGGPATTPLRFPGQYHDAETGLHYNFYRYYDPAQAHYLSRDPLGMQAGPNPRAYVPNPTTMLDPLGLFMCVQSEAEEVADIASRNNFPTAMASVLRPAGHDQNSAFYGFSGRGNHDIRTGRNGSYANQNRLNGRNPETHKLPGGTTQHPRLTQALNNVPPNRRAENLQHGGCAEMDAVNQALHDSRGRPLTGQALQNRLDELNGGRMGIAGVDSKTGGLSDRQGRYFPPCTTCDHVLGQFGIRPSGHSDPTLAPRPLPQAAPAPAPAPRPAPAPAPPPASSGPAPSGSTTPPKTSWADIAKRR